METRGRTVGLHLCLWITTQRRQKDIPAHKAKRLWGGGTVRPLMTTPHATSPLSLFPGAHLVRSSTSGYTAHQESLEKQGYEIMGSTMTATLTKPFSQLRSRKTIPRERHNVTECSPYGRLCSKRQPYECMWASPEPSTIHTNSIHRFRGRDRGTQSWSNLAKVSVSKWGSRFWTQVVFGLQSASYPLSVGVH